MHAEGDEQVPVELSRALHAAAPGSRLIAVPGGHHRSIQHDAELHRGRRALPHAGIAAAPSDGLSAGVRTSDDAPASSTAAARSSGRLPQRAARANSMIRPK